MSELQGYKVIPLRVSKKCRNSHTVFAKENSIKAKDPRKPSGKTLFLLNIPPYVTEEYLRYGLRDVGEIISVIFSPKAGKSEDDGGISYDKFTSKRFPYIFKVAYVVFKSTKSLEQALQLKSIDLFGENGKTIIKSGVDKWMKEYVDDIADEDSLQAEIDKYMADYDRKEQEAIEAEKSAKADNEGWVTVTKRGRNAGFEQKESVINKLEEKMERSKKNKELKNFYTFQIRESKMQNIVSLRKKFEEDKKRIDVLKKSRRFKPF